MDTYSRLVLSVIAICLLALVLGQAGLLPGLSSAHAPAAVSAGPAAGTDSGEGDRFTLTPIRVPPQSFFLIRHDHHTGQTWKVKFPSSTQGWEPILEADEAREKREARRAAQAAKKSSAPEAAEKP